MSLVFLFWRIVAVHEGLLKFFELGTSSCSPQQIPVWFVLVWSVMETFIQKLLWWFGSRFMTGIAHWITLRVCS